MLATLLATDMGPEEKLAELHNKYGIMVSKDVEAEVRGMGGIGQMIYEDGVEQGRNEARVADVQGAMRAFGVTAEAALEMFGVPREEWPPVLERLREPAAE